MTTKPAPACRCQWCAGNPVPVPGLCGQCQQEPDAVEFKAAHDAQCLCMIDTNRGNMTAPDTPAPAGPAPWPPEYDPDFDNCAGGCRRNDNRRVVFGYFGLTFACPGCFEEAFGGPPQPPEQPIIVLSGAQVVAGRGAADGTP